MLGCLLRDPSLMESYPLTPQDFDGEDFHQIVFAAIYNLYYQGVKVIDIFAVDSFLSAYDKQYKIFNDNKGLEYLTDASGMCEPENFEYNYYRIKKLSLLRYYQSQGMDISTLYNDSVLDPKEQEIEQRKFDSYSVSDIIGMAELRYVIDAKRMFADPKEEAGQLVGAGLVDLIHSYQESPEVGYPMQSQFMNALLRGARKKTFYLRSGGTGSGKSRMSFADTCCACIPWRYNLKDKKWDYSGFAAAGLIISTELKVDEVQSIILAFVSGVPEDHIIDNTYEDDELERVMKAAEYIESCPLYLEYLPNFDLDDVTNLIKRYKREKNIEIVNFDYLHTSIKMLIQISTLSKGMRIREDQVLFMASDALKTCSTELGIHVDSATQLNGDYKDAKEKDQNILRGSKWACNSLSANQRGISISEMLTRKPERF